MQDLSRLSAPKGFRGDSAIKVQLRWVAQATLFVRSPQVLYRWWVFLLRLFGAEIGKNVVIRPLVKITYPWGLTLGDYAWVGDEVNLYTLDEIIVGTHSVMPQESCLCIGSHDHASRHFTINITPIVIGERCWLTTDVFVALGVTIGDDTVVGVRSNVSKSFPANVVCRGSPAVVIRERVEAE